MYQDKLQEKDERIASSTIEDLRNCSIVKKEINGNLIKDMKNHFGLKKENEAMKDSDMRYQ